MRPGGAEATWGSCKGQRQVRGEVGMEIGKGSQVLALFGGLVINACPEHSAASSRCMACLLRAQ